MARGGGGGGRGGGFSGGGFRGGSSFRPTSRPVYHHHPRPVHHHGTGGYPGGNGCGGCGCSGFFTLPILLFLMIAMLFGNSGNHAAPEPDPLGANSERSLEAYAAEQYDTAFGSSSSYEDNLLLTFLVYDDRSDFTYIAWVGNHINDATFALLGGNETLLGQTLENEIAYGYGSTLSTDLEHALDALATGIVNVSPEGRHTCTEDHSGTSSYLINDSELALHSSRLNNALAEFTDATGIPIVLVVEDASDIFG